MKLLARYNRVNLLTTIIVMLITGIIYYLAINWILTNKIDKDLAVEENEVFEYVNLNHKLPQVFESKDLQIDFTEATPGSVKRGFINTVYRRVREKDDEQEEKRRHRHGHGEEFESGRGLISSVAVGDKFYKILIVESKVETEDLIKIIFGITAGVILLLLITLFITNRLLLNRLWQPFYNLLKELRLFNVADSKDIPPVTTSIDEFDELNQAIISMATRVKSDYKDLKTFTENASHELLTPIAVINSKLDSLIQTESFSQQQSKLLNDLYSAVSRLTRLNQSLLLLVKIENHLVGGNESIDLRLSLEELLSQFEEIFQDKELKVNFELADKELHASPYLIDILLNNLLSNAIRHNYKGGTINIKLTSEQLIIQNTGEDIALEDEHIFTRFHKSSHSEGSGLGLTISRQICENLTFTLNYSYDNPYHTFIVKL
ncbi:sensor histidine kinase [Mucilaginibacter sp. McL0603]|uniref:sensor histidine kinase n=1 Tax=Mucilaginibacter sp. McL0603 TaxID=3415670 RepID=UPI003CF20BED